MRIVDVVIVVCWVAFWGYWLIAAAGAKRTPPRSDAPRDQERLEREIGNIALEAARLVPGGDGDEGLDDGRVEVRPGAAVQLGELPQKTDCEDLGGFLVASLQGAILQAKAERRSVPIERFKRLIFSTLLH